MKTTIFIRILMATLLPVLLVNTIVIITARGVIYQDGIAYARESVELSAKQISEQTAAKLENAASLQEIICKEMANIDFQEPGAKNTLDGLLTTLTIMNRDLYATWFAFEPGVLPESDGRYFKSLLRIDDEIQEVFDMSDEQLNDPEASPWYNVPLSSGRVYANISDYYDFTVGEGAIHTFTMSYPVITADGQIIGCVGLDIRYEDLFPMCSIVDELMQRNMMISQDGMILFSPDVHNIGNTIWDYGFQNTGEVADALRQKSKWQGEIDSPFTDERMLLCLYPIEIVHTGQTIYLYRATPVDILYNSFYPSMQFIVATGVLGMILLVFCVFFSTRSMAGNVRRITDSFYRVASESAEDTLSGEHIPIYETNVIELDTLQKALVKMMIQLRSTHELKLKAVEAEVEKEKVIASAQAKTNFFATMSHEIRTPMNAILGIAGIMLYEGDLTPTQEKNIQDIKISAAALLNIINDILDISKLETGKTELRSEHYNFRSLIGNITSLAAHLAADASLRFIYEPNGELPPCLYGDGVRLRQVLLNLIGNAVKFTKEGYVKLRIIPQDDTIRFDVTDTGIGIKEDEIETIFETFKQLDTRRDRKIRGTGLGLSISKSLVELIGGTISVESVYGEGSTFSMTIPLVLGDEKKLRKVRPGTGARYSDSLRVLVVDDDATNLNVSSGLLRAAHGIMCDTALSGHEAIKKVQETDYDIIFMDHMMPELDGVDTTQRIRQLGKKYRDIPIIALTANAMIGTRKELMDGGMSDFLAKPIRSGALQEILNTWVPTDKLLPDVEKNAETVPAGEVAVLDFKTLSDPLMGSMLDGAGVDTFAGLENSGFDEGMYIQSLRLLKDGLPKTIRLLDDLVEQQDSRELRVYVHGLKGSLANIGAAALSKDAENLELLAAEGNDDCLALLPSFIEMLRVFHDTLGKALLDEDQGGNVPFDEARFIDNLQRLCAALENYKYEEITSELDNLMSMKYEPEKKKAVSQLKLLIDSFDYPGAATLIREKLMHPQ